MSEISLHTAEEKAGVYVSNTFIDTYMKDANGEYVKIYLYLLRALGGSGKDFSIAGMADALEHTTKDITRALHYWEREGLLRLEYNAVGELTGICLLDPDKPRVTLREETEKACTQQSMDNAYMQIQQAPMPMITPQQVLTTPVATQQVVTPVAMQQVVTPPITTQQVAAQNEILTREQLPVSPEIMSMNISIPANVVRMPQRKGFAEGPDHSYSPDEITLLGKDDCVREILFVTESYMGHPLSPSETNTVLYWYDGMGMSSDLIEYLVEYCIERGHKNIRYMNRVAIGWNEEGIASKEDAVGRIKTHNALYKTVRKAFGIMGRELTSPEEKYIDTWQQGYGFTIELIEEACERTIMKAHKPSFAYADSILKSWYESGVRQLTDVAAVDEAYSKKEKPKRAKANVVQNDRFHNFQEQQYDYDAIERKLLMQE